MKTDRQIVKFGHAAEPEQLLTEQQAIDLLALNDRPNPQGALRWLIRTNKLGCVRLGRILCFKPSDIRDFVERCHRPAKDPEV